MDQSKLIREVSNILDAKGIGGGLKHIDIYLEYLFSVILINHKDPVYSKSNADAKTIHQMIFTKVTHLRKLLEGVDFKSKNGSSLDPIIDPTIIASLIRNIYETVCLFNLIYIHTKNQDEKLINYALWVISGLKYRQRFSSNVSTPENKQKLEEEELGVQNLILQIEATTLYKGLDAENQKKIQRLIKDKEYKMCFEKNNVKFLSWQELSGIVGFNKDFFENIYSYFSLYSHPSNVAVFQFEAMFGKNDEAFKRLTIFKLNYCFALLSVFIADYIKLFPNVITTYNNQSLVNQIVIDHYNRVFRGAKYSINESWKELGIL